MKKLVLILLGSLLLSGCSATIGSVRLPDVTAKEVHYVRKDTVGGTEIHVTNLDASDPTKVTADEVVVSTTYPFINFSVVLKGYERKRVAPVTK